MSERVSQGVIFVGRMGYALHAVSLACLCLCLQAAQHLKPDARLLQPPSFTQVREERPGEPEATNPTHPAKGKKKKFFSKVGSHRCLKRPNVALCGILMHQPGVLFHGDSLSLWPQASSPEKATKRDGQPPSEDYSI